MSPLKTANILYNKIGFVRQCAIEQKLLFKMKLNFKHLKYTKHTEFLILILKNL